MKSWVPSLERIKRQQPSQGGKNSKKSPRKLQQKTSGILSEDILEVAKFPILDKCSVVGTKDNHTNFQGLGIKISPLTIPTLVGPGVRVWGIGYQISNLDRWGREWLDLKTEQEAPTVSGGFFCSLWKQFLTKETICTEKSHDTILWNIPKGSKPERKKLHIEKKEVINVKLLALWQKKVPQMVFYLSNRAPTFLSPWNMLWYFIGKTKKGSTSIQTGFAGTFSTPECNFKCSMQGISFPFWASIWRGPVVAWLMTQIGWLLQGPLSPGNIHCCMHPVCLDGSKAATSQNQTPTHLIHYFLQQWGIWHYIVLWEFRVCLNSTGIMFWRMKWIESTYMLHSIWINGTNQNRHKNHWQEELCGVIYRQRVPNQKAKVRALLVQLVNTE